MTDLKFRAVALLDRDGTINEEVEYLSHPDEITLIPGAADAIRMLNQEGVAAVLTTNQSGIARGYFSVERLAEIHDRLAELLAAEGARLDAIYHAPSLPDAGDPDRKPGIGMYKDAVRDLGLEGLPAYSIGDRSLDVEFGLNCGGKGIRVLTGHHLKDDVPYDPKVLHETRSQRRVFISENLLQAVHLVFSDLLSTQRPKDRYVREKFNDLYLTARALRSERKAENRIVLANGCFDLLHGGHISYLKSARELGDRLVLAINSNASVSRLKGTSRPLLSEIDRVQILASLRYVDYLTIFHHDSADYVLEVIQPHIHAKGTDYKSDNVPELQTSRRLGIETKIAGDPKENSSRDIIELVLERAKAGIL